MKLPILRNHIHNNGCSKLWWLTDISCYPCFKLKQREVVCLVTSPTFASVKFQSLGYCRPDLTWRYEREGYNSSTVSSTSWIVQQYSVLPFFKMWMIENLLNFWTERLLAFENAIRFHTSCLFTFFYQQTNWVYLNISLQKRLHFNPNHWLKLVKSIGDEGDALGVKRWEFAKWACPFPTD